MSEDQTKTPDDDPKGEGPSVWRYAKASRATVIIDADGYFELVREAMVRARQRIFLIGWDFDTRITLSARRREIDIEGGDSLPTQLGHLILWIAKRRRDLEVRILKWNFSMFKSLFRGRMIFHLGRWAAKKNIDFKFDSAHPFGASHHQKIVCIDEKLAVCGGIDMTSDRWDTRDHLHEDIRRVLPNGKPYQPWHDVTMMMEGEIAQALGELGRSRWEIAGGGELEPCKPQEESPWPKHLAAEFENVEFGIARTRGEHEGREQIAEIEALFVEHIKRAKRFVYAETQYFASRVIAEAIAERLKEDDPPEFVILNPRHADGWLEEKVMDTARARLFRCMEEADHKGRFGIYMPYTSGGTAIYVHAKVTIVDDEILRVGSANMNNRSMGLDSECDVFLDAQRPANAHIGPAITRIRHSLLAEHCDMSVEDIKSRLDELGSMHAVIGEAAKEGRCLKKLRREDLTEFDEALADSEVFDPERPDEMFESVHSRGLFRRKGSLLRPRSKR